MKRYFAGIDVGSSAIHSAILDEFGRVAYVSLAFLILALPLIGLPKCGKISWRILLMAKLSLRLLRA